MKTRILWMVISGLMALSLVAAACGPALVEETEKEGEKKVIQQAEEEEEEAKKEVVVEEVEVVAPDTPQYGGWLYQSLKNDPRGWDEAVTLHFWTYSNQLTNQMLLDGDWSRGPAGTGEFAWTSGTSVFADKTPNLVESYEFIKPGHIRWHIRPGIYFGLNPDSEASRLVGGREYTAEDLKFTLKRNLVDMPRSYVHRSVPLGSETAEWTVIDKYTLDLAVHPDAAYNTFYFLKVWSVADYPQEVIEKYGDMNDWRNVVGTGAFLLTDYVPGSAVTLIRNPNFWQTDPVGPGKGNQLPYVDGVRQLIIPDLSTRLAALRTGRIDTLRSVSLEDAEFTMLNNPGLDKIKTIGGGGSRISFRLDNPDLPQHDIRVRKALHMAIDFNEIVDTYFGGEGSIRYAWPCCGGGDKEQMTKPIEERSAEIQELYSFNPAKSKELLTEAGYPNGFKIQVVAQATNVDYLSIIKFFWEQIGVEMEIKVLESGAYSNILNTRQSDETIYNGGFPGFIRLGSFVSDVYSNSSMIDTLDEVKFFEPYVIQLKDLFFEGNEEELYRVYREEIADHVLSRVYVIPTPSTATYIFWQPWLENYYGAASLGWTSWPQYSKYVWINQELKEELGH